MYAAGSGSLQRFVDAQSNIIDDVFKELKDGKKQSHWMWFVFPQLTALGRSATAKTYGIDSVEEAQDIGIETYLYGEEYTFIEWPALIADYLPDDMIFIEILLLPDATRKITLSTR